MCEITCKKFRAVAKKMAKTLGDSFFAAHCKKKTLKDSGVNARLEHHFQVFEANCLEVNRILQKPSCSAGTPVSGNIRFMRVFAGVL